MERERRTATAGLGVSLRCAPGRAARAVGNDTTVANGAEPPALTGPGAFPPRPCMRAVFSALRARIPHATAEVRRTSLPHAVVGEGRGGGAHHPAPPAPNRPDPCPTTHLPQQFL